VVERDLVEAVAAAPRELVHGLEGEPLRDEVRLVVGLVRVVLVTRQITRHVLG